jgi:polysaccharide export outer membrane protein
MSPHARHAAPQTCGIPPSQFVPAFPKAALCRVLDAAPLRRSARQYWLWLLALLGLAALLAASPAWADYKLGPNDTLRIKVYDHEDMSGETRVSANGAIAFPLLGEVPVAGLNTAEVEARLAQLLSEQGYLRNPQISVSVLEYHSQEVAVLGFVRNPGRYAMDAETTVADLIAMAGGVDILGADRAIVTRVAQGKPERQEVDLKSLLEDGEIPADSPAVAGDVIFVPRAPVFYIYGEVQKPGSYRLERRMTVAQALSVGGGVTPRGSESRVVVQRKVGSEDREVEVELTDPLLRDDVVYVKERWF